MATPYRVGRINHGRRGAHKKGTQPNPFLAPGQRRLTSSDLAESVGAVARNSARRSLYGQRCRNMQSRAKYCTLPPRLLNVGRDKASDAVSACAGMRRAHRAQQVFQQHLHSERPA
jgi:hypothetical protein